MSCVSSAWTRITAILKKTVLLIGHLDTVDVSDRWKTDPFTPTEIDGKVYGRGAMDMKGGLAAILETLTYYAAHLDEINGKILACFVADEEGLSRGTYQLVAEDVIHADYAIMGECRYDNVAVGFRGRYSFEVTVHGQTAHASHYPEVGENALISGGRLAAAIEALPTLQHPHLKHGTWCVRYMEGGNPGTLVVPEKCYLFVDRYVVPGETDEICIAQIMEAARSTCASSRENRPTCSRSRWRRIIRSSKFCRRSFTPSRARIFRARMTPRSAIRIF